MPRKKKKEEIIISKKTKRNVKKIIIIASLIAIIVLSLSFIFGMQIKFILQEEMTLGLTPLEKSYTVQTGKSPEILFNLNIENPLVCKMQCSYMLRDISENKILKNETSFEKYNQELNYTLPIPNKGEGQKLFNLKVTCNNQKTKLCSTNEKKYFKTALITVNYELTKEEKTIKKDLSNQLTNYLNQLSKTEILKHETEFKLSFLKKTKETDSIKEKLNSVDLNINQEFIQLWDLKEYYKLNKMIINNIPNITNLKINTENIINTFNSNLNKFQTIILDEKILQKQYIILKRDNSNIEEFNFLKTEIENTYNSINSTVSYSKFDEHISKIKKYEELIKIKSDQIINNITFDAKKITINLSKLLKLNQTIANNIE